MHRRLFVRHGRLRPFAVSGDGSQVGGNGRIVFLGFPVAQDANVTVVEAADGFRLVLHAHLHALTQEVYIYNGAPAFGRIHEGLGLGAGFY